MKRKFEIPGMYHPIIVKLVSAKKLSDGDEENVVSGDYDHEKCVIRLAKESTPEVKRHTLYHEISHHILYVLEAMKSEEDKCDLLASYLIKLSDEKEKVEAVLK